MWRLHVDRVLQSGVFICAFVSSIILLLIFLFLIQESIPVLEKAGIAPFYSSDGWYPVEQQYNIVPMVWGSITVAFGALLLAIPIALLSAVFVRFYAPAVTANLFRSFIELLAGIPSVVYGFWGLVVIVPLINQVQPPGASLLAGMIVLTLMILPTIVLLVEASFVNIPAQYSYNAVALGLSRWTYVSKVVLPAVRGNVSAAILLGLGRAIGETMAVLMVCGNVVKVPESVFDPIRTLTANIALEMAYATELHRSSLFVSGLILLLITVSLVYLANFMMQREP